MQDIELSLSAAAIAHLQQELKKVGKTAVRLSVREAGCSGLEYVMDFAESGAEGDLQKSFDGFDLFVDKDSYQKALVGLSIDYQKDLLSSSFVFHNPNKKGECGCGISFTI